MNKKLVLPICLVVLIGLAGIVYAGTAAIPIKKGWNLVSLSVFSKSGIEEMSNFKYGYLYDPIEKKYVLIWKDRDYTPEAKNKYNFQRGEEPNWWLISSIWLYSEKDWELEFWYEGDIKEKETEDYYLRMLSQVFGLRKGWNFIYTIPGLTGKSLNDIKGGCNILKAYSWDNEAQNWESLSLDETIFYLRSLDALGAGFIIKVADDCTLSSSGSSVTPPTIPN